MPQLLEWTPDFSVGVEKLDDQHKQLLAISNTLAKCAAVSDPRSDARFRLALQELLEYATNHFRDEEQMLEQVGYVRITDQYVEHSAFLDFLAEKMSEAASGTLDKPGVQQFIAGWWTYHILKADMQYCTALAASPPSSSHGG